MGTLWQTMTFISGLEHKADLKEIFAKRVLRQN